VFGSVSNWLWLSQKAKSQPKALAAAENHLQKQLFLYSKLKKK